LKICLALMEPFLDKIALSILLSSARLLTCFFT
jgi:hypothetical protein